MTTRSRINLFASAIVVAGGLMLVNAPSAEAATMLGGCKTVMKLMALEAGSCEASGGWYSSTYTCGENGYVYSSSCTYY